MKHCKKGLPYALLIVFSVFFTLGLISCGAKTAHTHTIDKNNWMQTKDFHTTVCTECGDTAVTANHTYGTWTTTDEPTCIEQGKKYAICTVCGYQSNKILDLVGHSFDAYETDAEGHVNVCRVCREVHSDKEVHDFGKWTESSPASCTAKGTEVSSCKICGYERSQRTNLVDHKPLSDEYDTDKIRHWNDCEECQSKVDSTIVFHTYDDNRLCVCGAEQPTFEETIDEIITVEEGRPIRVLQLSDPQIIDSTQVRPGYSFSDSEEAKYLPSNREDVLFKFIRDAIDRTQPDLIIMTGDLIYGMFDDSGASLLSLIEHMESYKIPWAPVYGNHDNESAKGAKWQNKMLSDAEYCLFHKGETDGNGNYTVGIKQGGEIVRVFYMMDSNSCSAAYNPTENEVFSFNHGFTENQLKWLYERMELIKQANGGKTIPSSMAWHIPTTDFVQANKKYSDQKDSFTIGKEVQSENGDFGSFREEGGIKSPCIVLTVDGKVFLDEIKYYGVDSCFVGHSHKTNTSVLYEGIRWTFGLKTGEYERHNESETGGTSITIDGGNVTVKHVYYDQEYQAEMDALNNGKSVEISSFGLRSGTLGYVPSFTFEKLEFIEKTDYTVKDIEQSKILVKIFEITNKPTISNFISEVAIVN